jgi:hypothetical protein
MGTNRSHELNRSAFGTLALAGLMSVIMAWAFCELALAGPARAPSLEGGAQVLGTYRVVDIQEDSRSLRGSQCKAGQIDSRGRQVEPLDECGKTLWVVRSENEIAFLQTRTRNSRYQSFMLHGSLFSPKCDSQIPVRKARKELFESRLCRAFHVAESDTAEEESFIFDAERDPVRAAYLSSASTLGIAGWGEGHRIRLPKGVTVPQEIQVDHAFTMVFLFIPATIRRHYTLERVGD